MKKHQKNVMYGKKQNKYLFALISIIIVFIVFHLIVIETRHIDVGWDEAVYIGIGKYIWSFGETGLFESIRPLGLPLLLGVLWKLQLNYYPLIIGFSIATMLITYMVTDRIWNKDAALLAMLLLATTPFFLQSSMQIMTEVPTTFFIMLTVWMLITKKAPWMIGCCASFAFLFKFPAGVLFLAVLLIFIIEHRGRIRTACVSFIFGFIVVQIPVFVANYIMYKQYTTNTIDALFLPLFLGSVHAQNIVHSISGVIPNLLYYPREIVMNNPLLIVAVFGCVIALLKRKEKTVLITSTMIAGYFIIIANKQLRFAVLFLPSITIFAGIGLESIMRGIQRWTGTRKLFLTFIIIMIGVYLLYPQILSVYRFYPSEQTAMEKEYYMFFNDKEGIILTTEPYFTAYTDTILAIPYYNNAEDAQELYEIYKKEVDYIIFNSDFYPCNKNQECEEIIANIEADIVANNEIIYEKEWNSGIKRIFKTK